ncbi:MAG: hypothetical protein ACFFC6_17430 [Promethearchaeota archaeon]
MIKITITSFKSFLFIALCLGVAILIGCDGDGNGGVIPERYGIYLEENCPIPDPSSVCFQAISSQGSEISSAELVVTDVSDVYASSLYLSFDSDIVMVTVSEGDFLNSDGSETELLVNDETPGLLIIGISRRNVSTGVDAVGSQTLLNLTIRPRGRAGSTDFTFSNNYLLDSSAPPEEIQGVSWCSGSMTVSRI